YQQLQQSAGVTLRKAWFDLAQARRSAGYRWISPDQYSGNMRASATVDPETMQIVRGVPVPEESEAESESESETSKPKSKSSKYSDPLHWFGMLVPPSLRDSQRGFQLSLDKLVELAQLQRHVMEGQRRLASAQN
ncbi:hypothetical protein EC988_009868, partial [Linderina pennispora]